jgi:hypothetical protein
MAAIGWAIFIKSCIYGLKMCLCYFPEDFLDVQASKKFGKYDSSVEEYFSGFLSQLMRERNAGELMLQVIVGTQRHERCGGRNNWHEMPGIFCAVAATIFLNLL